MQDGTLLQVPVIYKNYQTCSICEANKLGYTEPFVFDTA